MIRFLAENWQLKLMSLGFSLVLWFFVMGERRTEVGVAVPLELHNVPQGMVVTSEVPNTVDVRLSGPRALLADLDEKEIAIRVDLGGLKAGLTTFRRLDEYLRLPVGIRATRISPAFIDVRLERLVEKEVPVRVRLSGKPAEGFRLLAVETVPEKVTVRGGESEVSALIEVRTERVELNGLREGRELVVPLEYHGQARTLRNEEQIRVYLRIEAATSGRGARTKDKGVTE